MAECGGQAGRAAVCTTVSSSGGWTAWSSKQSVALEVPAE